ncbi:hypothetical protein P7D77_05325 [Enterococcus avium]|uniref:hypothetical protein n=1 Tax=Enterococcus avium TaxID=33945 RepID=UPI0028922E49|nr:hypothetical protein [Enterococcus avium]MDT2397384.1 hypothetical protein [Enterococcus avium]
MQDFMGIIMTMGFLALIVGIVMLVVALLKKKNKKVSLIVLGISFIVMVLGAIGVGVTAPTETASKSSSESEIATSVSESAETDSSSDELDDESTFDSEFEEESSVPTEVNIADYNTGVTYDNLARNPEDTEGQKVTLSGEIAQVIEDEDFSQYRLAIDGDYDKMVLIQIPEELLTSRVLENDLITVYGESLGTIDYESTMGGQITIPAVNVDKFEVTGQAE